MGYVPASSDPELHHLGGILHTPFEAVRAVAPELCRRRVERDCDPLRVARPLGGSENDVDRLLARAEIRREAALVAYGGGKPALVQQALQRVVDLGADLQRLGERVGTGRHDHELLEVEGVRRVGAAVDDVHHRHGQGTTASSPPSER